MSNTSWAWRSVGELFDIDAGKTMSAAAREGAEKTPFLRTSNVFWDEIDLTQVDEMVMTAADLRGKLLRPGDLLVCEGGEIGRSAIWEGQLEVVSFQNHLHRLRPSTRELNPRFYVYFFQSAFTQQGIFEGAGNNTTIPNISRNRLAALKVPQPSLVEQNAIVEVLAEVRKAIDLHKRSEGVTAELKLVTMYTLFTRGLRGELRQEPEFGLIPEGWKVGKLGNLVQFQRGFDITKSSQKEGRVPVISSGGIKSYHNEAAVLGPGVIIGRKGSIGTIFYENGDYWPHDTTLWSREFYGNSPKFVYYRLQPLDFKRLDSGAANPALNRNFLHDELISWPCREEQNKIVAILEAIDQKIDLHKRKRQILEELFNTLLHQLMTGQLRVDDLDLSALQKEQPELVGEGR